MTRSEIDAALNRAAAETMGWSWLGQGWRHPSGLLGESPPDYCSPDVPHSTLRRLLAQSESNRRGVLQSLLSLYRPIGFNAVWFYVAMASPRQIVAACLAALDKLPAAVTLDTVRESEEVER